MDFPDETMALPRPRDVYLHRSEVAVRGGCWEQCGMARELALSPSQGQGPVCGDTNAGSARKRAGRKGPLEREHA